MKHCEVLWYDAAGECLPANAGDSTGAAYAPVAKARRLANLAGELWEKAYDQGFGKLACEEFRSAMCDRAEERVGEAYDQYRETCRGWKVVTLTYWGTSCYEEPSVHEEIID